MQALIFDAYGTIFKVQMPVAELEQILGSRSSDFFDLWRTKTLNYTWIRTLMNAWIPFDQVVENALDFTMASFAIENEDLRTRLLHVYLDPVCFPEVESFLNKYYSLGFQMAILSNGTAPMLEMGTKQNKIDAFFTHLFSASEVQKFKTAPEVYQLVCNQLEIQKEDIIFFSSNAWDIAGATHFGFNSIWVNRKNTPFDMLGVQPYKQIQHLLEF